jgi:hypothetical protein
MRRIKTLASALVVALVVIASLDYTASAATGQSFILGKINKANKVTAVKRTTAGPALKLATTSSSAAPLAVNGRGKVANLNADRIDGLDSTAFARTSSVKTALSRSAIATAFVDSYFPVPFFGAESGFDTVTYDATFDRYRLKMTGISNHQLTHVAVVTPACSTNKQAVVSTTSADGMVDVWLRDLQGAPVKCSFGVVVFNMNP